jgi:hydrogenase/urease accessory protein HupE
VASGPVSAPTVVRVRWPLLLVGGLGLALCPSAAEAHLPATGLGPIYDGLLHFAQTPDDLMPALALALLAGRRGPAHGRRALFVLPAAWLVGGAFGLAAHESVNPMLTAISLVLLGGLVAADARLPLGAITALAALLGLGHGYLNGAAMAQPGPGTLSLLGMVFAVFTLVALAGALVVPLRATWSRVAVRVAGSWIAAIGLLLVGWGLRPNA